MRPSLLIALVAVLLAGCGGGASSPALPTVGAARSYELADFAPAGTVEAGRPVTVQFQIHEPSGAPMVRFRSGAGPHTGVHVVVVADDLSSIVHRHPPIAADGLVSDQVVFPKPGRYRVLVDVYPPEGGPPNFQLHRDLVVAGAAQPQPLPPFSPVVKRDGLTVTVDPPPELHVAQPAFLVAHVTDAAGAPVSFEPWFDATAHAIFFHADSLDYFHTHVCAPELTACTGNAGVAAGASTKPGELRVGVLLPEPGTWRLFLQFQVAGRVVTAPFTLTVR